jgi:hypothetical protein
MLGFSREIASGIYTEIQIDERGFPVGIGSPEYGGQEAPPSAFCKLEEAGKLVQVHRPENQVADGVCGFQSQAKSQRRGGEGSVLEY